MYKWERRGQLGCGHIADVCYVTRGRRYHFRHAAASAKEPRPSVETRHDRALFDPKSTICMAISSKGHEADCYNRNPDPAVHSARSVHRKIHGPNESRLYPHR